MIINDINNKRLEIIKKALDQDGVIAMPTETVYGLAIKHDSFLAYKRLLEIKQRNHTKVFTMMICDPCLIENYAHISLRAKVLIESFMPGPLTLLLPSKEDLNQLVGIRIPSHPLALSILRYVQYPLYVTSANISSQPDINNVDDLQLVFNKANHNELDIIVAGQCYDDKGSTIIKVVDERIEIVRVGQISEEMIRRVIDDE
ncbi:MAG: L-threonylcarbamoyladenylate synthase [Bacilli bacterium]